MEDRVKRRLPSTFAELVSPRYLLRVAVVIPPRARPSNRQIEGL